MTENSKKENFVRWLHEYSLPLIAGVICALLLANFAPQFYKTIVSTPITAIWQTDSTEHQTAEHADPHHDAHATEHGDGHTASHGHGHDTGHTAGHGSGHDWGHYFTLHFLVNDLFMVLFFGVAAKEITEACLPGGALNPFKKALNPLFATLGGIIGPVVVYLGLNAAIGQAEWSAGWGIPTATDIALAWLAARLIFGSGHPAISFLLLLAVADDAIGLGIIAIAYPDPLHPTVWVNACWIFVGMAVAYGLRRRNVQSWLPYVVLGGAFSWWGLFSAHLHPALALVFIVPFMPGPKLDFGLYADPKDKELSHKSPLVDFDHDLRTFIDCGLFFFALANAGVSFSGVTSLTWIILAALIVGKTAGITVFSVVATWIGFKLPTGMNFRHLVVTGSIAGLGLTVALFVSGQAFVDVATQDAAKMGALFSACAAVVAYVLALALRVTDLKLSGLQRWTKSTIAALVPRRAMRAGE